MKFDSSKKATIVAYILEKINEKQSAVSRHVSEAFEISPNTVHTYLNELLANNIIQKSGRDTYSLVSQRYDYSFSRSKGEIEDEMKIYDATLYPIVKNFSDSARGIWSYAFSEMVNNVIDHSGAEHLWVTIEKNALNITVSIIDDGIGVFENIQRYFHLDSVEDAIVELSKGKLTTDAKHHSGEGIFFTSRMMDEFILFSNSKAFSINKYQEQNIEYVEKNYNFTTCVILTLSNNTKKRARDIFDLYANDEDGFTKTRIPIRHIFESSPVSRSQAKRVANRLEEFTEVELDFENVDFMGQGFAHELFVVFATDHPEIKLLPLNMSEDVAKMYRHVKAN